MNLVKNRLLVQGNIKDLIMFIKENYESDNHHPRDDGYPSNYLLFFDKMFPIPNDIKNDNIKVYKWKMNNWGTLTLLDDVYNSLNVKYKHDWSYTTYELSHENGLFNPYSIRKLYEYSDMFYGENIHPDENELISHFNTTKTPPDKLIVKWIEKYIHNPLIFRLDYWDNDDKFVGNIHFDYTKETYILEHYEKDRDLLGYVYYMLDNDIKTINDYATEITELLIELKSGNLEYSYKELESMFVEEIESQGTFDKQVEFIVRMINYLNKRKS